MADSGAFTYTPIDLGDIAGGFIGSMANGVAGLLGMSGSSHYQRKNMREAARLQHAENVYWAEYNTPANQMARLKAAGLNPNLVYGNGANAQFQGSVSPNGAAPEMNWQPGTDMLTFSRLMSEKRSIDSAAAREQAQANYYDELRQGQKLDNERKMAADPHYMGTLDRKQGYENWMLTADNRTLIAAHKMLSDSQRVLYDLDYDIRSKTGLSLANEMVDSYHLENEAKRITNDRLDETLRTKIGLDRSMAEKFRNDVLVGNALVDQYNEQTNLIQAETDVQRKEVLVRERQATLTGLQTINQRIKNAMDEYQKNFYKDSYGVRLVREYIAPIKDLSETLGNVVGAGANAMKFIP